MRKVQGFLIDLHIRKNEAEGLFLGNVFILTIMHEYVQARGTRKMRLNSMTCASSLA